MEHEEVFLFKTPYFSFFKKALYDPFLWMVFHYLTATEPLQGVGLFFTTTSPGIPGTYLIDHGKRKETFLWIPYR